MRYRLAFTLWMAALFAYSAAALCQFVPQPIARDDSGKCADALGFSKRSDGASGDATKITAATGDDRTVSIGLVKATATAKGCFWTATVLETGEAALLMTWNDGRLTGAISYRGKILRLRKADGIVSAAPEFSPALSPAVHSPASALAFGSRPRESPLDHIAAAARTTQGAQVPATVTPFSDRLRAELEAREVVIDLMVLYTPRVAESYVLDISNLIRDTVEQVNLSFQNSGLGNVSLRLVHAEPIAYTETGLGHFEHLYRMVDGIGIFERVGNLRNEKKADIVGLIVDDPSQCGLATRVAPDPEEAYFVVHHSCAALTFSIAHEVGHILGARHEPQIDADNAPSSYAFAYVSGREWRDIMSYAQSCDGCPRQPRWSNPRVQYRGKPTGTPTSDAARIILEQAERVARFR